MKPFANASTQEKRHLRIPMRPHGKKLRIFAVLRLGIIPTYGKFSKVSEFPACVLRGVKHILLPWQKTYRL